MKQKAEFLHYFRQNNVNFSRFYTRILFQANLTLPQYTLLNQLAAEGTMPMTDASEKLHISKPAVTHLVDRLEKNKFLERISHLKDRRIYLLEIQPKGKKIVRQIQSCIFRYLLKVLDQFNEQDRKTIVKFHALIAHTMDQFLNNSRKVRV